MYYSIFALIQTTTGLSLRTASSVLPPAGDPDSNEFDEGMRTAFSGRSRVEAVVGGANLKRGQQSLAQTKQDILNVMNDAQAIRESAQRKLQNLEAFEHKNSKTFNNLAKTVEALAHGNIDLHRRQQENELRAAASVRKISEAKFEIGDAAVQNSQQSPTLIADSLQKYMNTSVYDIKFSSLGLSRLKWKDNFYVASFGGGGCIASLFESGFVDIMNFVQGPAPFFPTQSGASGGFWGMMQRELWPNQLQILAGNMTTCGLLDYEVRGLAPAERVKYLLSCIGCAGKSHADCKAAASQVGEDRLRSIFGWARGCVRSPETMKRLAQIPELCRAFFKKTGHICAVPNVMAGVTSSVLPPIPEKFRPRVDIHLPVAGEIQEKLDEPEVTLQTSYSASVEGFFLRKWTGTDWKEVTPLLNKTLPSVYNLTFDETYWQRFIRQAFVPLTINFNVGSKLNQATMVRMAAGTSLMPNTILMNAKLLISTGLCTPGKVELSFTVKNLLKTFLQPLINLWSTVEHSDVGDKVLGALSKTPGFVEDMMWDSAGDMLPEGSEKAVFYPWWDDLWRGKLTTKPLKLVCSKQTVQKWFNSSLTKTQTRLASTEVTDELAENPENAWKKLNIREGFQIERENTQVTHLPCWYEESSPTVLAMDEWILPMSEWSPTAHQGMGELSKYVIGDSGEQDTYGLGSTLTALQSMDVFLNTENSLQWHVVQVNAKPMYAKDYETQYFLPYSKISNTFGRTAEVLEALGADCSDMQVVVPNVNHMASFPGDTTVIAGQQDIELGSNCTWDCYQIAATPISLIENQYWGARGGKAILFSRQQFVDEYFVKAMKGLLSKDYQDVLEKNDIPPAPTKKETADLAMSGLPMLLGEKDIFLAWFIRHAGELNAAELLCAMLMPIAECSAVFDHPQEFLLRLQKELSFSATAAMGHRHAVFSKNFSWDSV